MLMHGKDTVTGGFDRTVGVTPAGEMLVTSAAPATPAGAQQVQGNVAAGAVDAGNPVKIGGVYNAALPSVTSGQRAEIALNAKGMFAVSTVLGTTAADAQAGAAYGRLVDYTGNGVNLGVYGFVFNGTTWDRARGNIDGAFTVARPSTSGGTDSKTVISLATTNATVVKASAGQVFGAQFANTGAATRYLKLYNKATAPTVGTDVPVDIIAIPAGSAREINRPLGMVFSAGIAFAITALPATSDTTVIGADEVVGSLQYK